MNRTDEARKFLNKMKRNPNFQQKYYRVTNLTLSPYIENGVYTEYEFLNDPNFEIWEGLEYKQITKEEYEIGKYYNLEVENELAREFFGI